MHRAFLPKALALTVLIAGLTVAGAQQSQPTPDANATPQSAPYAHHHHAPDPQKRTEHLTKKLKLTPDQTAKLEPILADRDQKMQAVEQNTQLTPQDRHQQMLAINQQAEQQMTGVLTPDQMTQLKAMHREHRGHGNEGEQTGGTTQSPS